MSDCDLLNESQNQAATFCFDARTMGAIFHLIYLTRG